MAVSYSISGQDAHIDFFENAPAGVLCPICGSCLDESFYPRDLRVQKVGAAAVLGTYDGRELFSHDAIKTLKAFVNDKQLIARKVSSIPCYFDIVLQNVVEFDAVKRRTLFGRICELCGNYMEVTGATPVFIKEPSLNRFDFARTDLEFGSVRPKGPIYLVSDKLKVALGRIPGNKIHFREINPMIHLI